MRYFSGTKGNSECLESESFLNILTLALRQGRVPLKWKFLDYSQISNLTSKFFTLSLSQEAQKLDGKTPHNTESKAFVNWKQAMTYFTLMNSNVPSEQYLADLQAQLSEISDTGFLTREQFLNTELWFDEVEGKPDSELVAQWEEALRVKKLQQDSDDESEDEEDLATKLDEKRLSEVKELIFDIHRVATGEDLMSVSDFVGFLRSSRTGSAKKSYGFYLFEN